MSIVPNMVTAPRRTYRLRTLRHAPAFSLVELLITMALIIIMFVMLYGKGSKRFQYEQKQACQGNLHNIYVALQIYANDANGLFPIRTNAKTSEQALALLIPRYTTVTAPFVCPGTKGALLPEGESFEKRRINYAYYMGRGAGDPTEPVMTDAQVDDQSKTRGQQLFSRDGKGPGNNHNKYGGNIMTCDGNVEMTSSKAPVSLVLTQGVVLLNPKP